MRSGSATAIGARTDHRRLPGRSWRTRPRLVLGCGLPRRRQIVRGSVEAHAVAPVPIGEASAEGGRLAYHAVARAVELALRRRGRRHRHRAAQQGGLEPGRLPLSRPYRAAGHADRHVRHRADAGARPFRVTHVTTHVALERVPSLMTAERVRRVIELTLTALRRLGIERPRVAIAALNPHAGEGGIFGRQDIEITDAARGRVPRAAARRSRGRSRATPSS